MIFAHLDHTIHIASFGAAHPLLFAHGFACILRDRLEMVDLITWTNTRIACVGDYLWRAQDVRGLLPDDLRDDMNELEEEGVVQEYTQQPLMLYKFAAEHFASVRTPDEGPVRIIEDIERDMRLEFW